MALRRRTGGRFESNIWAGFVDAMTALLLVIIFVLSIFMIMQFFLRQTIVGQGNELDSLQGQLAQISETLGATRQQNTELEAAKDDVEQRLAALQFDFKNQSATVFNFEEQVAALIAKNALAKNELAAQTELNEDAAKRLAALSARQDELSQDNDSLLTKNDALNAAIAAARSETDQFSEEARLAAARADALQSMVDDLGEGGGGELDGLRASIEQVMALAALAQSDQVFANSAEGAQLQAEVEKLTALEQAAVADQIAADYLRERLKNADTELNAMTLALEEERRRAEESLTLLAALDARRQEVLSSDIGAAEKDAALLKIAQEEIAKRKDVDEESARQIALLNRQTANLRGQLGALQGLLDAASAADAAQNVQVETMGASLNAALAKVAAEERRRANDLEQYRSEFFGKLRQVLEGVEGVEIVGDRFVFSSEVLFPAGSANLSPDGREQIGQLANLINEIATEIPENINWILRVDGHTDTQPVGARSLYADNWELSQARALSVVRFLVNDFAVDPRRLAATGFSEFHPIVDDATPDAMARNRRIELKLTEQ